MKTQINCKNCQNPFGELQNKTIELNYKRVSNIQHNFETKETSVKCRNCAQYSKISFEDNFINEVDYKRTASKLLG